MDPVDRLIAELIALFGARLEPGVRTAGEARALLDEVFAEIPAAFEQARQQAYDQGWEDVGDPEPPSAQDYAAAEAAELADWWRTEQERLVVLLDTEGITPDVVVARARSVVEREASTQLSTAHSEGLDDAATASPVDWVFVLVPERDACLRCTSYAGSISDPGGEFPLVRSFDGTAEGSVTVPVHPRCRCQKRLTKRTDAETTAVPLRREAERSVARFDALPSESDRARTEAAKRLLEQGSSLPKTVLERAGRQVRKREKVATKRTTLTRRQRDIERELRRLKGSG